MNCCLLTGHALFNLANSQNQARNHRTLSQAASSQANAKRSHRVNPHPEVPALRLFDPPQGADQCTSFLSASIICLL